MADETGIAVDDFVTPAGDEVLTVEFYRDPVTDQDLVKIEVPGDDKFMPIFLAEKYYQHRFPRQWSAYQNNESQFSDQTPIDHVPWLDGVLRNQMKARHIHTVEQLAATDDNAVSALGMGARALRDKAIAHVEAGKKAGAFDEQRAEIEELKEQMEQMAAMMEQQGPDKRGPGRPRKEAE